MATKSQYLTLRISSKDKDIIAAIARRERRTVSQVASLMLSYATLMKWEMILDSSLRQKESAK